MKVFVLTVEIGKDDPFLWYVVGVYSSRYAAEQDESNWDDEHPGSRQSRKFTIEIFDVEDGLPNRNALPEGEG